MTAQEKADLLRRNEEAAQYGPPPAAPTYAAGAVPAGSPPGPLFNPDAALDAPIGKAEWFQMPGGGVVAVHPCSLEDIRWVSDQVMRDLGRLNLLKENRTPEEQAKVRAESVIREQTYQCIAVCRQSLDPASERVFHARHAEKLLKNQGWGDAVQQIKRISDALGEGLSEAALLREVYGRFFARTASTLETWCSSLSADSLDTCRRDLEQLAACVSLMRAPELLSNLPEFLSEPDPLNADA
jgi:hypothetical protein